MAGRDLGIKASRTKAEGKVVGKAAQAFNVPKNDINNSPGYIMGNLLLPPKCIKDAESVGKCTQTFTVCHCQPGTMEVAYGDPNLPEGILQLESAQRFYLSPGDLFQIPPGNCYRLENHSSTSECLLTWTIFWTAPSPFPPTTSNDEEEDRTALKNK
jgi:centromere protein C